MVSKTAEMHLASCTAAVAFLFLNVTVAKVPKTSSVVLRSSATAIISEQYCCAEGADLVFVTHQRVTEHLLHSQIDILLHLKVQVVLDKILLALSARMTDFQGKPVATR